MGDGTHGVDDPCRVRHSLVSECAAFLKPFKACGTSHQSPSSEPPLKSLWLQIKARSGGAVSLACALCAHQSPKSALYQTHHSRRASSNFSKHERLRQSFQRLPVKAGNVEQSLKGLPKGFQRFFSNMKGFVKPFRNLRGTVYAPEVSNFEHVMFLSILLSSVLSSQASFRHWKCLAPPNA